MTTAQATSRTWRRSPDHALWVRRTVALLVGILLLRIVSLWFNNSELFFDEAQYWFWGENPAFGYFSKPPLLAWIIGATTAICGDSEFCVRLSSPLMHTATAGILFATGARLFDARTGFWVAATYLLLPAVTLSSSLISTDVPLLLCWSAALFAYVRLDEEDDTASAVALGLAIGLGMLAKYAMGYFLLCAAVHALADRSRPPLLMRRRFWLAIGVAAVVFLPNVVWNLLNGNPTVAHTGENISFGDRFPNFGGFAEFFGSQFAVMGPVLFGIYLAALVRLPREGINRSQVMLIAFSAPVLALICAQAILSKAYANWAAVAYVAATLLVVDLMVNRIPDWWLRLSTSVHAGVFAVLAVAVAFAGPGQLPLPEGVRPFARMQGAREIAAAAEAQLAGGRFKGVVVDERRLAALMNYYLRDAGAPVLSWREGPSPRDHFEMSRPYQADPVAPVLYLTQRPNPVNVVGKFSEAELLQEVRPKAGEIRHVWFYALRNSSPGG